MLIARIARSILVALGLALLMPLSTLAATPFQATAIKQACTTSGGAHGGGYVELKVKGREVGLSGTNYMVFKSKLQANSGISWSTQKTFPDDQSNVFPNDSSSYYHVTDRRYDFPRGFGVYARIVTTVEFWSNSSGLLAKRTVKGASC